MPEFMGQGLCDMAAQSGLIAAGGRCTLRESG